MRHHLVVNLQPIGMIYEVMERRMRAQPPNLGEIHESAQKINGFARAALDSSLDVVTWLAPDETATVSPSEGVRECLGLLGTSLTFRGFALRNELGDVAGRVRRPALRTLLTAALIYMTDENRGPAELQLSGRREGEALVIDIKLRTTDGETGFAPQPAYRALAWSDVDALAPAAGPRRARAGRQQLTLFFPWAATD